MGGKGYKPRKDYAGRTVSGDWEDSDRGEGNKSKRRAGLSVKVKSPSYLAHVHNKKKNPVVSSYQPEGDVIGELNRYGKETGKATGSLNKRPGSPVKKGGDEPGALRNVRGMIRKETGKPEGQKRRDYDERHRSQDRRESPADTVTKRREAKARADAAMRDTRGT